jgi:hypothetical protein
VYTSDEMKWGQEHLKDEVRGGFKSGSRCDEKINEKLKDPGFAIQPRQTFFLLKGYQLIFNLAGIDLTTHNNKGMQNEKFWQQKYVQFVLNSNIRSSQFIFIRLIIIQLIIILFIFYSINYNSELGIVELRNCNATSVLPNFQKNLFLSGCNQGPILRISVSAEKILGNFLSYSN